MLEFIKELMPLLEVAKNGAVWLVAAYFGLLAVKMFLIAGVILALARMLRRTIFYAVEAENVVKNNWSMYQWDRMGEDRIDVMFKKADLQDLLSEIAGESGSVYSEDIAKAVRTLRNAKAK